MALQSEENCVAQVHQNRIEFRLRNVHHSLQRRHRDVLPLFRVQRSAQQFQIGFVWRQQAGKKMAVQPLQVVQRVANSKARVQIEQ